MEDFLPAIIISVIVAVVLVKQIGKITQNIDARGEDTGGEVYAAFAGVIQEKIREIKKDIDSSKETPNPLYVLKENEDEERALEELSDMIRKLVFFETMGAKRDSKERVESEMFGVLSALDSFVSQALENGEELADGLREELFGAYETLKQRA